MKNKLPDSFDFVYLTDEEIQHAFNLAYILHPNSDIALYVTSEACELISEIRKSQARRPFSHKPHKEKIPDQNLLHYAVFKASFVWEQDQESNNPRKPIPYKPTRDDMIVRYIKHIIWETSLHSSCFVGIGLGCHLYTYQPNNIANLSMGCFDESNLRRVKKWIHRRLRERFNDRAMFQKGLRPATDADRILIERSLKALTPSFPSHASPSESNPSILEIYFNPDSPVSELERMHVLMDPHCAGFQQLILEYNELVKAGERLSDPEKMLGVPLFSGFPSDPMCRFDSAALPDTAKSLIRMTYEKDSRRKDRAFNPNSISRYFSNTLSSIDYFLTERTRGRIEAKKKLRGDSRHKLFDYSIPEESGEIHYMSKEEAKMPKPSSAQFLVGLSGAGFIVGRTIRRLVSLHRSNSNSQITALDRTVVSTRKTSNAAKSIAALKLNSSVEGSEKKAVFGLGGNFQINESVWLFDKTDSTVEASDHSRADACITDWKGGSKTVDKHLADSLFSIIREPDRIADAGENYSKSVRGVMKQNSSERFHPPQLTDVIKDSLLQRLQKNHLRRSAFAPVCNKLWVIADGRKKIQFSPKDHACSLFKVPNDTTFIQVFGQDKEGELMLGAFVMPDLNSKDGNTTCEVFVSERDKQTIHFAVWPNQSKRGKRKECMAHIGYSVPSLAIDAAQYCAFSRSLCLGDFGSLPAPTSTRASTATSIPAHAKQKELTRIGLYDHLASFFQNRREVRGNKQGLAHLHIDYLDTPKIKRWGPASVSIAAFIGTWVGIACWTKWTGLAFPLVFTLAAKAHKKARNSPNVFGGSQFTRATMVATILSGTILLGYATPQAVKERGIWKIETTKSAMQKIATALNSYKDRTGSYPQPHMIARDQLGTIRLDMRDPWGQTIRYEPSIADIAASRLDRGASLIQYCGFELRSPGPDGAWKTKDDIIVHEGLLPGQRNSW